MKKYQTILADPPWEYGAWGWGGTRRLKPSLPRQMPYQTMTLEQIEFLPVSELADINCELYIWTTQRYLPCVFDVISIWGFKYCQTLTWCKTPRGLGMGGIYCPTTEFLILARKGKMPKVKRQDSTWFLTKRPHNSHSTKPEFFQDLIEQVTNPPRLELFARRKRMGWDCWGNEVDSDIELGGIK